MIRPRSLSTNLLPVLSTVVLLVQLAMPLLAGSTEPAEDMIRGIIVYTVFLINILSIMQLTVNLFDSLWTMLTTED